MRGLWPSPLGGECQHFLLPYDYRGTLQIVGGWDHEILHVLQCSGQTHIRKTNHSKRWWHPLQGNLHPPQWRLPRPLLAVSCHSFINVQSRTCLCRPQPCSLQPRSLPIMPLSAVPPEHLSLPTGLLFTCLRHCLFVSFLWHVHSMRARLSLVSLLLRPQHPEQNLHLNIY